MNRVGVRSARGDAAASASEQDPRHSCSDARARLFSALRDVTAAEQFLRFDVKIYRAY